VNAMKGLNAQQRFQYEDQGYCFPVTVLGIGEANEFRTLFLNYRPLEDFGNSTTSRSDLLLRAHSFSLPVFVHRHYKRACQH